MNPDTREFQNIDDGLLQRILNKDTAAFSDLYDRHSVLLYSISLRILKEKHAAEEVVRTVFSSLWDGTEVYDKRYKNPAAWLARLVRDLSIQRLRSVGYDHDPSKNDKTSYEEFFAEDVAESPERLSMLSSQQEEIMIALSMLSNEQKELIEYAYYRGYTLAELAEHFKISLPAVTTKINTAMSTLRQKLKHRL